MSYRARIGLNYVPAGGVADPPAPVDAESGEVRREPGDVVNDLPATSIAWLLEQSAIEEVV